MNLKNLHPDDKGVQTKAFFTATEGKVISLQIRQDAELKEHTTPIPALLVCVSGEALYEDEKGNKIELTSGDFVQIKPSVKHRVLGIKDSNLLLIK